MKAAPMLALLLLAAACSPSPSAPEAASAAYDANDPDAPTPAEARAAANAPPPSKLSAAGSRLSGQRSDVGAPSAAATAGSAGLGGGRSALNAQVTGLTAEETDKGLALNMSSDVLFDFDQAALKPEAAAVLQQAAAIISERGAGATVTITGHTDSKGTEAYNIELSLARARAVQAALAQHGVSAPMQVYGRGEAAPVAANTHADGSDNPEGRAQNRRVEVLVATQGR